MNSTHELDRSGVALIVGCVLLLGIVGAGAGYIESRREHPPSTGATVILLDRTDRLSALQVTRVLDALRELEDEELRPGDRVVLYTLGAGETGGLERAFSGQFPGRHVNPLFANENQAAERCDTVFTTPLRLAAWQALQTGESPRSPILEAVAELSDQPELRGGVRRRTLIVISNLMENMSSLSLYRALPEFESFQRSAQFQAARADLHGVQVDVRYLPGNPDALERTGELRKFWGAYFDACSASSVRFARL